MTDSRNPEKKLHIDEDWKEQVAREKQQAAHAQPDQPQPQAEQPTGQPLPPANLTFLASTLYLQGMVGLGLIPNPATNQPQRHLDQAKHAIDTLQMLQEKTEGNRTEDETRDMQTMLYELRMAYVSVAEQGGEKAD